MNTHRKLLAVILTAVMIVASIPISKAKAEADEERKEWLVRNLAIFLSGKNIAVV